MNDRAKLQADVKQEAAKHIIQGTYITANKAPVYCPWCGAHVKRPTKSLLIGWTWDCFGGCNP